MLATYDNLGQMQIQKGTTGARSSSVVRRLYRSYCIQVLYSPLATEVRIIQQAFQCLPHHTRRTRPLTGVVWFPAAKNKAEWVEMVEANLGLSRY